MPPNIHSPKLLALVGLVALGLVAGPARAGEPPPVPPDPPPAPPAKPTDPSQPEEPPPDEITVKGDTLRGRIVAFGADGIEFDTVYGSGTLSIPLDDVEYLAAYSQFQVRYGSKGDAEGRLLRIEAGEIVVGETVADARRIPIEEVKAAVNEETYFDSWLTRLRTNYSHWSAEVGVALRFETGAVDKNKIEISTGIRRDKAPWRLEHDLYYAFENQRRVPDPRRTTKDELFSTLWAQYDGIWESRPRAFLFGRVGGEFDTVRNVDGRFFPSAGAGYRVFDRENVKAQVSTGFGYVWQDFTGFASQDFAALHLGGEILWKLPYGAEFTASGVYLPKLANFSEDWLFRLQSQLTVPIWDPITMFFRFVQVNDSNPTPDTGNNKIVTSTGLGLKF